MAGQDRYGGTDPPVPDDPGPEGGARHRHAADNDDLRLWEDTSTATSAARAGDSLPSPIPVAGDDGDWMTRARLEAETPSWEPGATRLNDLELDLTANPSLVRPYARTGGRTKPGRDLDLEALVHTTVGGKEASTGPWLNPEHMTIIEMCTGTVSVAEIAARLPAPIGVARVIIADMVDLGLVEVMKTSAAEGDERDPAFLRRVLSGLQRL